MVKELLQQYLELCNKEHEALIKSLSSINWARKLEEIVNAKEELLTRILQLHKEEVAPHKDLLQKIDECNQKNAILAKNSLDFIQEIFIAIFPQEEHYSPEGIKTKNSGLINKKA